MAELMLALAEPSKMRSSHADVQPSEPISPRMQDSRRRQRRTLRWISFPLVVFVLLALLSYPQSGTMVAAADDATGDDADDYYGDDATGDDATAADDATADDATGDDATGDDYYGDDDDDGADDEAEEEQQYVKDDDDLFEWDEDRSFDGVTVMPMSCINYNNGHMIRFDLFDKDDGYQCHFNQFGSFVVSIAHYMRAYFNYQALVHGKNFQLPGDAGYLNCVMLQETTYSEKQLYAKIGCMERETFTSTKLQIHVYTDSQCSMPYDDGQSNRRHAAKGYHINGYTFSTQVSFRPPFYSCLTCTPEEISDTFNKKNSNWYDDDYIYQNGQKEEDSGDEGDDGDDQVVDDAYMAANDDVNGDDATGDDATGDDATGDDATGDDDDYYNRRSVRKLAPERQLTAAPGQLEAYHDSFWGDIEGIRRSLYDNYYDVGDWNMCERIYKYGVYCDEECKSLEVFRVDEWSKPDIFLLAMMCIFMAAMMLLVVAKRLKAAQKARLYGDDSFRPGLPPLAMALIFLVILVVIIVLAKMKFVNETLVFAVVTCILLFIYMLKLTLFETPRPVLLATPKHHIMFDNTLEDRLF